MSSNSNRSKKSEFLILVIVMLTIIFSLLITIFKDFLIDVVRSHITNINDVLIMLSPFFYIILIWIICVVIYIILTRDKIIKKNQDILCKIFNTIDKLSISSSYPWLLTQNKINEIEENASKYMEIWIVTPDLNNDTQIHEIIEIVKKNMERGVQYTYVVPNPDDDPEISERVDDLRMIYSKYKDSDILKIVPIHKKHFFLFGNMTFTIYNPKKSYDQPTKVYLELPREELKWWVELSQSHATIFKREIMKILKKVN